MSRSPMERALGIHGFITLRGIKYRCSPIRLRHLAEAKAFLAEMAPDPLKELSADAETFKTFPPEIQKALAVKALEMRQENRNINSADAHTWVNSEEGVLFLFWCMVRDAHKELATFNAVLKLFPPGIKGNDGELSIPECDLLRQKIDEVTLGEERAAEVEAKKKAKKERKKKQNRKSH